MLRWLAWLAAAVAAAAALYALARWQVDGYLADAAARQLAAAAYGETPYRWRFADRRSIVGRRAFGAAQTRFDEDGVHVTAEREGTVELGVVLPRAADLERFPQLVVKPPVVADIVVREHFDEPERIAALPASVAAVDLRALAWHDAAGAPRSMPRRAAMLRLRMSLRADAAFDLSELRLDRGGGFAALDLTRPLVIDSANAAAQLQPLFLLDLGRPEIRLAQRDALVAAWPTAIVLPDTDTAAIRAQALAPARGQGNGAWIAVTFYAASLLALRLRPPRHARLRAALELAGALAGPLALVLGGGIGDDLAPATAATIGLVFMFCASLKPVAPWRWLGNARTWRWAGASVLIALAVGLVPGHAEPLVWPNGDRVAHYLGWAVLQQYLVCVVIGDRLRVLDLAPRWCVLTAAFAFALLHTPNAALMQFTFVGSLLWTTLWLRRRTLLPIAVAHAASALVLAALLPVDVLRSFEISARFVS